MVNRAVVAKSNEDLYPKSLEAKTNQFVNPWVVIRTLLRSDQSSLLDSESYLRSEKK